MYQREGEGETEKERDEYINMVSSRVVKAR